MEKIIIEHPFISIVMVVCILLLCFLIMSCVYEITFKMGYYNITFKDIIETIKAFFKRIKDKLFKKKNNSYKHYPMGFSTDKYGRKIKTYITKSGTDTEIRTSSCGEDFYYYYVRLNSEGRAVEISEADDHYPLYTKKDLKIMSNHCFHENGEIVIEEYPCENEKHIYKFTNNITTNTFTIMYKYMGSNIGKIAYYNGDGTFLKWEKMYIR